MGGRGIILIAGAAAALSAQASPVFAQAVINTGPAAYTARITSLRDMPFRTVVRQQFDYSCGSAALATLLSYHYGVKVGEAEVFRSMFAVGDQAKIQRLGFSLLDMKKYLASIGFDADGYRADLADLRASRLPSIALVRVGAYRHFVVIKGVRADKVLVGDPATGLKSYALSDFIKVWDGVIFVVKPREGRAAFNLAQEWGSFARHPQDSLSDATLSGFTRELPPIYQISAFGDLGRGAP